MKRFLDGSTYSVSVAYITCLDFHDACTNQWPWYSQEEGTLHGKFFSGRIDFFEKIFPVVSKIIVRNTVCLRVYDKQCLGCQFLSDVTLSKIGVVCVVIGIRGKRWLKRKSWNFSWYLLHYLEYSSEGGVCLLMCTKITDAGTLLKLHYDHGWADIDLDLLCNVIVQNETWCYFVIPECGSCLLLPVPRVTLFLFGFL